MWRRAGARTRAKLVADCEAVLTGRYVEYIDKRGDRRPPGRGRTSWPTGPAISSSPRGVAPGQPGRGPTDPGATRVPTSPERCWTPSTANPHLSASYRL